jgi:hypothetical protein
MINYTKGTKVIHKRTLAEETIVGPCKMKINDEWVDGVIYEGTDRFTNKLMMFVKPKEVFDKEFIYAEWYGN